MMKRVSEVLFLGGVGGSIYYGIEMIYRGFSHWTMFVLGGGCMIFMGEQGRRCNWSDHILKQIAKSTVFVAIGEFLTGLFVNKWMKWNIWDYSNQPFNLMGQICLRFLVYFSLLCIGGIKISEFILKILYKNLS